MQDSFDFIIVGAGSAGCILANRLSANPLTRVLLIEAASDSPPGTEPPDVRDSYPMSSYNPGYFWPEVKAFWRDRSTGGAVKFPQAKVMGGGSAVAGMVAFRGTPDDYDGWAAGGAAGWAWSDVLPYFCKLENDQDFSGPLHGNDGPIPIRRIPRSQWPPLTIALESYCRKAGYATVEDMNGDFRDGFGVTPINSSAAGRVTTAAGYLTASVRGRRNLTILAEATFRSLRFDATRRRVVGIEGTAKGHAFTYDAAEVILCTGTIHSPAILMRSGIGDAEELGQHGIDVVAHRVGVGKNLQNHAALFVGAILRRGFRQTESLRTHPTACLRISSNLAGAPTSDVYVNIQSKTSWNAMGLRLASLNSVLLKPEGSGSVSLAPGKPSAEPVVEFRYGDHINDMRRLATGLKTIVEMMYSPEVASRVGRPFIVRVGDRIRKWNALNTTNAIQARLFALVIDFIPSALADRLLARLTGDSVDLRALVEDDNRLLEFVRREVSAVYHPVGTCRMGSATDIDAVVDADARVIGVSGLRVIDASIMPSIPRGNTNIPTMMLAEKLADQIIRDRSARATTEGELAWTSN